MRERNSQAQWVACPVKAVAAEKITESCKTFQCVLAFSPDQNTCQLLEQLYKEQIENDKLIVVCSASGLDFQLDASDIASLYIVYICPDELPTTLSRQETTFRDIMAYFDQYRNAIRGDSSERIQLDVLSYQCQLPLFSRLKLTPRPMLRVAKYPAKGYTRVVFSSQTTSNEAYQNQKAMILEQLLRQKCSGTTLVMCGQQSQVDALSKKLKNVLIYRKNIDWYLHEHMLLLEATHPNKIVIADGFCFVFSQIHFDSVIIYSEIS